MEKIGLVLDGYDIFVKPIETALREKYQVDRFEPWFLRLPLIGKRVNALLLAWQLRWFLQNRDAVFFEWAGPLAALGSRQPGRAKRIVRAHRQELFGGAFTLNWPSVDGAIFVSKAMRARFLRKMPQERDRTTVVYNGVDLSRFSPSARRFSWRIGILGHLTPRKRIYGTICALAELPDSLPWQLTVGGSRMEGYSDYYDALQYLACRPRVSGRVLFAGQVSEPSEWLRPIDIFISASYSEGQQVSLAEAMASGCYCLSHCWDGAEEMLPAENIYTTDVELRNKLLAYAALSEAEQRQAQAQMRALAEEKFDGRRMVTQTLDLIEEVLYGATD